MPTPYEQALNEFKDASAAVRLAFGAQCEDRAAVIIANRNYAASSEAYLAAQDRLESADDALQTVSAETPAPADIDVSSLPKHAGKFFGMVDAFGEKLSLVSEDQP